MILELSRNRWNPNLWTEEADWNRQNRQADWDLGWAVVNMLMYCNNAMNFFLYLVSGRKFRNQLKQLLSKVFSC